jgi:flagellar biosynthetic protein FliO
MEAIQQMAAVTVVILLLGATLWVLRRRGFAGMALGTKPSARRLECLERLPLGPQHTLHLVRVGETELLVALSPSGCVLVERLTSRTAEVGR